MLKNNAELLKAELVTNTIYYIEHLARKFIYNNREDIRRNSRSKKDVLVILDFLIEKGSVVGYMLRESILKIASPQFYNIVSTAHSEVIQQYSIFPEVIPI
jgi:hypothetical protein